MKKQKLLAKHLLELANRLTQWNFLLTESGGYYYMETMMTTHTKETIIISFIIKDWYVLLKVWSPDGKYNDGIVKNKLIKLSGENAIANKYGIYSTVLGEKTGICINSPIPLEVFEREMDSVIRKLMVGMTAAMLEIIRYGN